MTLITYPSRVHFADGVLEEALYSELERIQGSSFLLVFHKDETDSELMDRVLGGLPSRTTQEHVLFGDTTNLREQAFEIAETPVQPGAIIAFGSSKAIEFGRKIRYTIDRASGMRPVLFGIPAIDGLPDPCHRKIESKQAGLPSVIICDPTVIMGAGEGESREAAMMSLIRCVEAYLSATYNPPADGIALDGLSRCLTSLHKIGEKVGLDLCRDVMAAGLNAFLSQEKGVGPAQTMTQSMMTEAPNAQRAAIARLVLPGVLRNRAIDDQKADVLGKVLSDVKEPLAEVTRRILSNVQMPRTLADIGVPHKALDPAAESVAGQSGLTFLQARAVLEEVYEGA
ncbi:iron-containing alcohol dehydrogenase [Rhodobacteraceae bacterium]|nr:iron-containing alcohol dehydrogenase [Paracoccaceae bacterium]